MQEETRKVQIGDQPTPEMLKEIEKAAKRPIVYDEDSPKLTEQELSEFVPYFLLDHNVYKPRKTEIHLRVDTDVLLAFKKQGRGYQTRMNEVLRKYIFQQ
jgi:uncharacterized protein (DUF4415 family)